MFIKPATIALAAAALTLAPAAGAKDEPRTSGIAYGDLDLSTKEGVAELDRRIEAAAREVCGMDESTLGTRIVSRDARNCLREARRQLDQHFAKIKRDASLGG